MNMQALPDLTLPQMLRERARTDGERIAIRQKDFGIWKPNTWAQYHSAPATSAWAWPHWACLRAAMWA